MEVLVAEQRDWNTGDRNLRLPKGHLEPGESLEDAALREVLEEVGVVARIVAALTPIEYAFWHEAEARHVPKVVHFFLMEHHEGEAHAADGEMERPTWCALDVAARSLTFESERGVVLEAVTLLGSGHPLGS